MARPACPEPEDLLRSFFAAEIAVEELACPPPPPEPVARGAVPGRRRARGSPPWLEFAAAAAIAVAVGASSSASLAPSAAGLLISRSIESGRAARVLDAVSARLSQAAASFAAAYFVERSPGALPSARRPPGLRSSPGEK